MRGSMIYRRPIEAGDEAIVGEKELRAPPLLTFPEASDWNESTPFAVVTKLPWLLGAIVTVPLAMEIL